MGIRRTAEGDRAVHHVGQLMAPRRCLKCRRLFAGPRCPRRECSSRQARGYGAEHQAARRALAEKLPAPCPHCPEMVYACDRWLLRTSSTGIRSTAIEQLIPSATNV